MSWFSGEIIIALMGAAATLVAFLFGGRRARAKEKAKRDEQYIETRRKMDEYARTDSDLSIDDRLRKHSE